MKILYLSYRVGGKSGAAKSSVDVLNALSLVWKDILCYTPLVDFKEIFSILFIKDLKFVKYFIFKNNKSLVYRIQRLIIIFLLKIFRKNVKSINNDDVLLIVNTNIDEYYINYIKRNYNVKITVNINRGGVNFYGKNNFKNQLLYLNSFDYVIFLTKSLEKEWRYIGFSKKSFIIPNCVDRNVNIKNLQKIAQNINKNKLAYIGSIQKRKGQDIALNSLIKNDLKNLSLYFYGSFDPLFRNEFDRLLNKAQSIGIDASYQGYKNINYIYSHHDIIILCSRGEAMPRTVLEALMFGKIVIASNTDGIKDILNHGINGFVYDVNDDNGFYNLLVEVMSGKYDLKEISKNAISFYNDNYIFDKYVSNWRTTVDKIYKL